MFSKADKNEVISRLFSMSRLIKESLKKDGGIDGVSFDHIKTFYFIKTEGNPTMKEVADYLGIAPPSATSLINPFVKRGLIKRHFDEKDRRIVRLSVTEKGEKIIEEGYKGIARRLGKILSKLSGRQIKNLKDILNTLS